MICITTIVCLFSWNDIQFESLISSFLRLFWLKIMQRLCLNFFYGFASVTPWSILCINNLFFLYKFVAVFLYWYLLLAFLITRNSQEKLPFLKKKYSLILLNNIFCLVQPSRNISAKQNFLTSTYVLVSSRAYKCRQTTNWSDGDHKQNVI